MKGLPGTSGSAALQFAAWRWRSLKSTEAVTKQNGPVWSLDAGAARHAVCAQGGKLQRHEVGRTLCCSRAWTCPNTDTTPTSWRSRAFVEHVAPQLQQANPQLRMGERKIAKGHPHLIAFYREWRVRPAHTSVAEGGGLAAAAEVCST